MSDGDGLFIMDFRNIKKVSKKKQFASFLWSKFSFYCKVAISVFVDVVVVIILIILIIMFLLKKTSGMMRMTMFISDAGRRR